MKWNGYNSLTTQQSLQNAWNEKAGNSAEINLLLIVMLQKAGIKTNPVILSTRKNGMLPPRHSLYKMNYVIACAEIDGKKYLMDATDPFSRINMLPERCLNGNGRLISESQNKPINLQPQIAFRKNIFGMIQIQKDKLQASLKTTKRNYAAYKFREKYTDYTNADEYKKTGKK